MGCKLPTMDNFLCCISLETGGYVIGWLTSVFAFLGIIISVGGVLIPMFSMSRSYTSSYLISYAVYLLFYFILAYASIQLVKASKSKNHTPIRLYLVILCCAIIVSILLALFGGVIGAFGALVGVLFFGYIFISVYSLYEKLKKQNVQLAAQVLHAAQALQAQEPPSIVIMKY